MNKDELNQRLIGYGFLIFKIGKIKVFGLYTKEVDGKLKKFLHYLPVRISL